MSKTPQPGRTYVSLSFSVPPEMEEPLNKRAAELRTSRSDYLRRLVEHDLYRADLLRPEALDRDAPPRIRRGRTRQQPSENKPKNRKKPKNNGD